MSKVNIDKDDISTLLDRWSDDKAKIAQLEGRIEKYKRLVGKIMDEKDIDELASSTYKVKRRTQSRSTISKTDVPNDIWKEYSRKVSFDSFYLSQVSKK